MTCHVYIDYKPDGTPFYVGKGTSGRIKSIERNKWHSNVCKKHPTWYRTIVETASDELCKEFEIFLISIIGRKDLGLGTLVNLTDGGEGMLNPSKETREKLSASSRSRVRTEEWRKNQSKSLKGRKCTPEQIAAMSIARTGKPQSKESCLKRSLSMKGKNSRPMSESQKLQISLRQKGVLLSTEHKKAISNGLIGRKLSDETKLKLSVSNRGKTRSDETKSKMRNAHLGVKRGPQSIEHRQKLKESNLGKNSGKRWVTDGIVSRFVPVSEVDEFLSSGFHFGRLYVRS